MITFVQAAVALQKSARSSYGYAVALGIAALTLLGVFSVPLGGVRVGHLLAVCMWMLAFVWL